MSQILSPLLAGLTTDARARYHQFLIDLTDAAKANYNQFFAQTEPKEIEQYARGAYLAELAELATRARSVIHIARLQVYPNDIPAQDQWQLDQLSEVKKRLAQAIQLKRNYYEEHWFGIITKFFLKLIGQWNGGDTAAIVKAEDFLLFWDSRKPVMKISNYNNVAFGKYSVRGDFQTAHLNTSQFFNYNPCRAIELETRVLVDYKDLSQ